MVVLQCESMAYYGIWQIPLVPRSAERGQQYFDNIAIYSDTLIFGKDQHQTQRTPKIQIKKKSNKNKRLRTT